MLYFDWKQPPSPELKITGSVRVEKAMDSRQPDATKASRSLKANKLSRATKASMPLEATKASEPSQATKASRPLQEGISSTFVRKVKKVTCLGEPDVIGSETDLNCEDKGQGDAPADKVQPRPAEGPSDSEEDFITNELNHSIAKKFKELDKKLAKRAAKKAAKEAAQQRANSKQEKKRLEKQRKKEQKRARKEAKQEKKRAQRQRKLERKAARMLEKRAKKGPLNAVSTSSSGLGDSVCDEDRSRKKSGLKKVTDSSPVSASSDNSTSCHQPQDLHQRPPSGCPHPPGSPEHQVVCSALIQTSIDSGSTDDYAVPIVEEPLSTSDDVAGMSYRSPSQHQSPITVQRRHSRSSSPARLVSPSSSVTRVSPQASRTPHPPSGFPRTDYVPSVGRPIPRRFNTAGVLDNNQAEKSRFSRYGSTDINANNTRIDPLSNLHVKHAPSIKLQQQTRQQPLRAVHPQAEVQPTVTKNTKLSRLQSYHRFRSEGDDLADDITNLQIDDSTPGPLSPVSSTTPSRRSSFNIGQRSKVSSSDLKCPPITGASPPEGANKPKLARNASGYNSEYKSNFAGSLVNQSSASSAKVPSRTKAAPLLEDHSKSEGDKEKERKPSRQVKPAFTSAQHSVLGTGRTGNYPDEADKAGKVGLNNLGNSCYMNAILQCLAQNKALREYFLSDEYLKDVNHRSPREGSLVKSTHWLLCGEKQSQFSVLLKEISTMIHWLGSNPHSEDSATLLLLFKILFQARNFGGCSFLDDDSISEEIFHKKIGININFINGFAELMKQIWNPKQRDPFSPSKLQTAFHRIAKHFGAGKQQDAQEFMCYFICELHQETNTAPKKQTNEPDIPDDISEDVKAQMAWDRYCAHNDSIFSRLFVGQLKSTLECQTCKNRSVTFDIFWDLSVPVPERAKSFQRRASWERVSQPAMNTFDIKDCLNKFTEAEVLDGDNMVTCDKCKKKRVFTKRFSIQRFPKHLVLHLKRFSGLRAKLTTHIEFPLQGLDMSRYLTDDTATTSTFNLTTTVGHLSTLDMTLFSEVMRTYKEPPVYGVEYMISLQNSLGSSNPADMYHDEGCYNLGGVSQHSGSIMGGHYIAYAKHLNTNKWHCYDDSRVDPIPETSVPSSFAYVLFYEQADQQ